MKEWENALHVWYREWLECRAEIEQRKEERSDKRSRTAPATIRCLTREITRTTDDGSTSPWSMPSEDDRAFGRRLKFEDWFDGLRCCVETEEICSKYLSTLDTTEQRCPRCGLVRAPLCFRRGCE